MNIVVCVKRVPDTTAALRLDPQDLTLDRTSVETVLNPMDEYAVEEALRLQEAEGGEVAAVAVGPEDAERILRSALALGADRGIRVTDDRIAGSDAMGIALVLAAAIGRSPFDLVLMGAEATDARTGLVPQALAQHLGVPGITHARKVTAEDGALLVERDEEDGGTGTFRAELPAVVSVAKGINEPRYPSLRGVMAAKQKPVEVLGLDELGLDPAGLGLEGARTRVLGAEPTPPKARGTVIEDDGEAHLRLADFLAEQGFVDAGSDG